MIDLFVKGGALMWPIALCSVIMVAIIIHKTVQFTVLLRQFSWPRQRLLDQRPSHIAPLLDVLAANRNEEEIVLAGSRNLKILERGVGALSLIAAIAPLMGLTGTVLGIIESFRIMAASGGTAGIGLLAKGIWEALLTTAAGLLVAIPAEIGYHYLERRLDEISIAMKSFVLRFGGADDAV